MQHQGLTVQWPTRESGCRYAPADPAPAHPASATLSNVDAPAAGETTTVEITVGGV